LILTTNRSTWKCNGALIKTDAGSPSDAKVKHDITFLSEKYSVFFDKLRPVSFIYNLFPGYGDSQRVHTGFIANEVEAALYDSELTTQEFAGLVI
jgi:hypothetical protein